LFSVNPWSNAERFPSLSEPLPDFRVVLADFKGSSADINLMLVRPLGIKAADGHTITGARVAHSYTMIAAGCPSGRVMGRVTGVVEFLKDGEVSRKIPIRADIVAPVQAWPSALYIEPEQPSASLRLKSVLQTKFRVVTVSFDGIDPSVSYPHSLGREVPMNFSFRDKGAADGYANVQCQMDGSNETFTVPIRITIGNTTSATGGVVGSVGGGNGG
jgi:hypothetical protein